MGGAAWGVAKPHYGYIKLLFLLLAALHSGHGVGVEVLGRTFADLPQLTVRAATHFQLGLETVSFYNSDS